MTTLTTFILLGMVDSFDEHFATVELSTNPASNGGPATAVMPVNAFPCEIYEGKVFYVVKLHDNQDAVIVCHKEQSDENRRSNKD